MAALQGCSCAAGPLIRIAEDDPLGPPRSSKGARRPQPPEGALAPAIRVGQPPPARPALPEVSGTRPVGKARSLLQFSSVAQSCPTVCDLRDCSTPGLPVHHQLPELTQIQIHRVGDAIQPSHPLSSPSPPAPNLSQVTGTDGELAVGPGVARLFHTLRGVG